MNPLGHALDFLLGGPKVSGAQEVELQTWQRLPTADLSLAHRSARYVVVDTETTGLDLRRDRVIAIGAVVVDCRRIRLGDCFATLLRQPAASATANILVHGIGGQMQMGGVDPAAGMLSFLGFAGKSPLVAFRAEFDRTMLERGLRSVLGVPVRHAWIDLAFLLPALFPRAECSSLDDWLVHFGFGGGARHDATADAFATAQLLQIALVAGEAQQMANAAQLIAMQKAQRWLGKRH
jgi:DNA polymerase-3 subunit epsilon